MGTQIARSQAQVGIDAPLPAVLGNEAILVQVFENLIGNAIKFVAPGIVPVIKIHGRSEAGRAQIWIADNGIGIPPEQRERVFGVFERLHGEEEYPGTGIGLAIVKKGVERMGGSVGVASKPGAGSTFQVELPAVEDRP
jgi:signal transduction histidine kinase